MCMFKKNTVEFDQLDQKRVQGARVQVQARAMITLEQSERNENE